MKNTSHRMAENRRTVSSTAMAIYKLSLVGRLILETFLRRNFGKRYYSLSKALFLLFLLLCGLTVAAVQYFPALFMVDNLIQEPEDDFLTHYGSWLAFMAAFLSCALTRKLEASRNRDYSLSMGELHPLLCKIRVFGQPLTARFIETIAEPLLCLVVGFILYKLTQPIGIVIMVCSAMYAISYYYAYKFADHAIMDIRDAGPQRDVYQNVPLSDKTPEQPNGNDVEDVS